MHLRHLSSAPVAALFLAVLLTGCGGRDPAPLTGPVAPPGFAGLRMLVFPTQLVSVSGDPDRELAFALQARRGTSGWVFPPQFRQALDRSPNMDVPLEELPVSVFLRAEVRRIGDPLYGILRRGAAVTQSEWALIPVEVAFRPGSPGVPGTVAVTAAVVEVLTGRVRWFGTAEGAADGPDDPGGVARAMDALARQIVPGR